MAAAVAFSTLNALTLSPALCALFLRNEEGSTFGNRFGNAFNASLAVLTEKYQKGLSIFIRRKWLVGVLLVGAIVMLVWLLRVTPTRNNG